MFKKIIKSLMNQSSKKPYYGKRSSSDYKRYSHKKHSHMGHGYYKKRRKSSGFFSSRSSFFSS
ncbi:hypothetical protein R4Z10_11980 [Niallia sp. XMNu-256]|uniref:hypothetical protein n=1 Tax=Niallia sp. XMNu-256 TaxID=3082444 RepID=UPI0030CB9A9B